MSYTREQWAAERLRRAVERLQTGAHNYETPHHALFGEASDMGRYVADGAIGAEAVVAALVSAGVAAGRRQGESSRTVQDGIAHGEASGEAPWYPEAGTAGPPGLLVGPWGSGTVVPLDRVEAIRSAGTLAEARALAAPTIEQVDLSGIPIQTIEADPAMSVVLFPSPKVTQGQDREDGWAYLAYRAEHPHPPTTEKASLPLWSPYMWEGASRARGTQIERVEALPLDYDDDPAYGMQQVREWWGDVSHIAHTSYSHLRAKPKKKGPDDPAIPRGRVVLPLSRPVTLDEAVMLGHWVRGCGRGEVGKEITNRGRAYYEPSGLQGYEYSVHEVGRVLDADAMLEAIRAVVDAAADATIEDVKTAQPPVVKVRGGAQGWFIARRAGYVGVDSQILRVELARAHPSLVLTVPTSEDRSRPMSAEELYGAYGAHADRLVYSMVGDRAGYEPDEMTGGGTLTISVCRLDPRLVARKHDAVDEWIGVLAGDMADRVRDWLACVPMLDRPTAALYLQGSDSVGKGMLAAALGRLYGRGTASYADVLGGFNSALKSSPIVYLDERAPKIPNGAAAFRSLVGDRERALTEKYQPTATLLGCPRLLIAANNGDALRLADEDMESADERAIALRILHVMVDGAAKAWLEARGGHRYTAEWVERADGTPGLLCEHIAHLHETRRVSYGSRMLVQGDAEAWLRAAGKRDGLPRRVLAAVAAAATELDETYLDLRARPVYWASGVAQVCPGQLVRHWSTLTGEQRAPKVDAVGKALDRLGATHDRPHLGTKAAPYRPRVRVVDWADVVGVAVDLGVGDEEELRNRMHRPEIAHPLP